MGFPEGELRRTWRCFPWEAREPGRGAGWTWGSWWADPEWGRGQEQQRAALVCMCWWWSCRRRHPCSVQCSASGWMQIKKLGIKTERDRDFQVGAEVCTSRTTHNNHHKYTTNQFLLPKNCNKQSIGWAFQVVG